jgi:MYXO-CTERM domain-containing protein
VRLFSISTDVELPIALGVAPGGTSIEVLLGNLNNILVNLNATQSNILAENPTQLLKLIPLVLSLAGPSLGNIAPFALPNLDGFSLTVDGIHGIVPDGDGGYDDIGIFADLGIGTPSGAVVAPGVPPTATITQNLEPALADVAPGGTLKGWPTAVVSVDESGGPTESGWSVDDGMWNAWVRGSQLQITSPNFLIQGSHSILLRTRPLGSNAKGWTQTLTFVADYTPPSISLGLDGSGLFTLSATDNITPADLIEWSVSSGSGAFSGWATGTPDPNALAARGTFLVKARDQAGNVTVASSDPSAVVGGEAEGGGPGLAAPAAGNPQAKAGGCSSAPGTSDGLAFLALAAGLAFFRRRKR